MGLVSVQGIDKVLDFLKVELSLGRKLGISSKVKINLFNSVNGEGSERFNKRRGMGTEGWKVL